MPTVFISAENPHYSMLPLRADNARMYELLHDLEMRVPYPDKQIKLAQFVDRNGYSEKVFRVWGISLEDALELAVACSQESILVERLGLLNVKTMTYNPIIKKYMGDEAYHRQAFTLIEGAPAVAYDIDFNTTRQLKHA